MRGGADHRGQLGIDQLLHPSLEEPTEQLLAVPVAQARQQVSNSGIIVMGHRVASFSVSAFAGLTKDHAMAHPTGGTAATSTTSRDANADDPLTFAEESACVSRFALQYCAVGKQYSN